MTPRGIVETLDRYGKLFTDDAATVGDVQTLGADLVEPREAVVTAVDDVRGWPRTALAEAEQELIDAQAALAEAIATASSLPVSSAEPETATTTTIVAPAVIDRVQQAEDDLARTGKGITEATPLAEATAEYNSAAFALQIAWLQVARRRRLPHRRAAGRSARAGDRLHDDAADRAAVGRLLRRSDRRDLRPGHPRWREAAAGRQRPPRDRVRRQGHRRRTRRAVGRARPADDGRGPDPHRLGPDRAHRDRLLGTAPSTACGPTS